MINLESLESRSLLSFLNPFGQKFDVVRSGGAVDVIAVSGPGQVFTKPLASKMIAISLKGTTQDTTVSISSLAAHSGRNGPLQIGKIQVQTGRLGSFQALTTADLNGPVTPLIGPVNMLQFDALGSSARIDIQGNLTTLTLNRSVNLGPTGHVNVGGNLTSFTVGGNLQTSTGGEVQVTGNLGALSVTGNVQGKGSSDIVVGDDLSQLTVLGGGNGVAGLQAANIIASANILGIDIRNGIAASKIEAGDVISGGTPGTGSNGWNIGPDALNPAPNVDPGGQVSVFDSTIQAGSEITNLTLGGDVVSDQSNSVGGSPTRIIAGENPAGMFMPNGIIDGFQITGSLINSVVAASVGPNASSGFYDAPGGVIEVGSTGSSNYLSVKVSTAPPFVNANDPELTQVLTGGAINPSLAAKLQVIPPSSPSGVALPYPSKSTVLGSVVTTANPMYAHDQAGLFAINTNGVLVGPVPTTAPVAVVN